MHDYKNTSESLQQVWLSSSKSIAKFKVISYSNVAASGESLMLTVKVS